MVEIVATMRCARVWMRTTPCDEAIHNRDHIAFHRFAADCRAYNAAADAIMRRARIPILDLFNFTLNLDGELYCDHVHFHDAVRQRQAALIAGWLQGAVSQPRRNGCSA